MRKFTPAIVSATLLIAACQAGVPTNSTHDPVPEPSHVKSSASSGTNIIDATGSASPGPGTASATPNPSDSASPSASASPDASTSPDASASPSASASPTPPTQVGLLIKSYSQENTNSPYYEVSNPVGDRIMFWAQKNSAGVLAPTQARYAPVGKDILRVYYNKDGAPERIQNDKTGDFLIVESKEDSFTLKAYTPTGSFSSGYTIQKKSGSYQAATLLGQPYFKGQLALNMPIDVQNNKSIAAVLLPTSDNATTSFSDLPSSLQSFLTTGNLLPTLGEAVLLGTGTAPLASGFSRTTAGSMLTLAGLYAPSVSGSLLNSTSLTTAKPLLAAAMLMSSQWQLANGTSIGSASLITDTAGRFEANKSALELYQEQLEMMGNTIKLGSIKDPIQTGAGKLTSTLSPKNDVTKLKTASAVPFASMSVNGFSVDQEGNTVSLTGNVSSTGQLTASGSGDAGEVKIASANINTVRNGNFTSYLGNGAYIGGVSELGTCSQQQSSGGTGSYVKAHYMNTGPDKDAVGYGKTTFTYNAFTVPDQFTVFTFDGKQFGTPGLVSGVASKSIDIPNNWIVIVSVNAPQNGTQWEYNLSCPNGFPAPTASP